MSLSDNSLASSGRLDDWMRVIVGAAIVALVPMAQNWYSADRAEADRARQAERADAERTRHLRGINELVARVEFDEPPVPADSVIVRAVDLARLYRDDPAVADRAYKLQRVTVSLSHYVVRGNELHWHLGSADVPAVIVFTFSVAPIVHLDRTKAVWIVGTCAGWERDNIPRGLSGYDFRVRVTGCELVKGD
jgi:hypothetical protein